MVFSDLSPTDSSICDPKSSFGPEAPTSTVLSVPLGISSPGVSGGLSYQYYWLRGTLDANVTIPEFLKSATRFASRFAYEEKQFFTSR